VVIVVVIIIAIIKMDDQKPSSSSPSLQQQQPTSSSSSSSSSLQTAEDKTKRLLSLARNKLEENQATISSKDQQIQQLLLALEEERKSTKKYNGRDDDHCQSNIRNILRRVDVDDIIWVLIEYDSDDDTWLSFNSEDELKDFIARIPGAPIVIPPRCLTSVESQRIENESKKREQRIVEEFRRYKVRAEIARKQKDAETRQATMRSTSITNSPNTSSPSLSASLEKALTDGALGGDQNMDELQRMKRQLTDQEAKWRQVYEKVVKENELLRTRGSEAMLAAQWRERYEACIRERDDLSEKLKVYTKGVSSTNGGEEKSMEQAFIELKDEYKEFRRRVRALEQQRKDELEQIRLEAKINGNDQSFPRMDYDVDRNLKTSNSNSSNNWERAIRPSMGESKLQYVRQMVCQYLSCRDSVVKVHIESALIAMFRFNEQERIGIELRQKEEAQDLTTSITSFLGSFNVT